MISGRPDFLEHNWLVRRIHRAALRTALDRYASGILLDIGCGEKPHAGLTEGLVSAHIGLDHPGSLHSKRRVDMLGTAYETGVADHSVDTVLSTAVLEHLERPQDALKEMHRILKPGGCAILSAPMFWHLHEEPRDFYRYTQYGLMYLLGEAGFQVVELEPLSGFIVTFGQELCYFVQHFRRWPIRWLTGGIQFVIQAIAYNLNRWDRSSEFTWMYAVVARKPR